MRHWLNAAVVTGVALGLLASAEVFAQDQEVVDWRAVLAVQPGMAIEVDSQGFSLPTAIAFVPNPGPSPESPLYFVTELRGGIKVVTNDRTIYEFARVPPFLPPEELPALAAQAGLAGICLDPKHGFVFVTFASPDEGGLLRNHIMRFATTPRTFTGPPTESVQIAEPVAADQTALSHQIGGCQVYDDSLFVSVGDGGDPAASQALDRLHGKVLRMTLDGDPYPENPFFDKRQEDQSAASYVWAYGLRNPFGLHVGPNGVAVVDNGIAIDRFVRLSAGENYLWNGRDWSIGAAADAVFSPGVGPVQLDYTTGGILPSHYDTGYFFAASGGKEPGSSGVIHVPYDVSAQRLTGMPQYVVSYNADVGVGVAAFIAGLAFGPDGLYFALLSSFQLDNNAVFKLVADRKGDYPTIIGKTGDLIGQKECRGCHLIDGQGGNVGPPLDYFALQYRRLEEKLNSDAYLAQLSKQDQLTDEPFVSTAALRDEVRNATGSAKVLAYVTNQLIEPKFDNPNDVMPNPNLTREEADKIARSLLAHQLGGVRTRLNTFVASLTPFPATRTGDVLTGLTAGIIASVGLFLVIWLIVARMRRRHRASQ